MDLLIKKAVKVPPKRLGVSLIDNDVDEQLLKPIKQACKKDGALIKDAVRYLLSDVQRKNITIRMKCLFIMDALFTRSHSFRQILCDEGGIRQIAVSAGLLPDDKSTGDPLTTNDEIKERVKELVEVWDLAFGVHYPSLRAVARYLKESLKLKMPNVAGKAAQFAADRQRRAEESHRLLLTKRDRILRNARADLTEIRSNVARLEECFTIIFPTFDQILGGDARSVADGPLATSGLLINDPLVWMSVTGEELGPVDVDADEDEEENETSADSQAAKRLKLDHSGDDVAWEEASDSEEDIPIPQTAAGPEIAPFALELQMRTGLQQLNAETPDNAVVVQIMRELCKYLARHAVPMLAEWQTILAESLSHSTPEAAAAAASAASSAPSTTDVLRQVALLRGSVRKVLHRSKGIFDEGTRALLEAHGEHV